jgi:hypothetical protein
VKLTSYLIVAAILVGAVLQVWVPPGGLTLVAGSGLAGAVAVAVALVAPGRVRTTMAGFRFVATLLFVLAVFAMLGTLVLQGKPAAFYIERYGFVGTLIVALRFDDIFHGLPFALVMALFGASIIASATLRWPIKAKNTGYWLCHLGLMTSLLGAAASASLAVRGRIDLFAGGEHATQVRVTKAGAPTGEMAALGFDLRLDRFEAPSYESEYRIAYYEQERVSDERGDRMQWTLKASFDPDTDKHRLPSGDSFRLKAVYPDFRPLAKAAPSEKGGPALEVTLAGTTQAIAPGEAVQSPDGRVAVLFGWERPAAPAGVDTAVLVSGAERKVLVQRADGVAELPFAEDGAILGGIVRFGKLYERATRSTEYATASEEWKNPAAVIEVKQAGLPKEQLMVLARPAPYFLSQTRALLFEKRADEKRAYISWVTALGGATEEKRVISVNDPMEYAGWTLYQVNYNPEDPTYSGLEAVYDPGVSWVFLGFALICLGVFVMFYVEPRLKQRKNTAGSAA